MEMCVGVVESLRGKCILITGSTGFLAKIFLEKVLRVQPDVRKIYLLMRASDSKSAIERLQTDVFGKDLFNVLKEKHGDQFQKFISAKVSAIAGDISIKNLGLQETHLRKTLWSEVDVIVNVAATTNFLARYDVSLNINVLGARNALEFAKRCSRIQLLLHVSTAYVAGTQEGLVQERKFAMGETLNNTGTKLDIEAELRLANATLKELRATHSNKEQERSKMKQLGLERARFHGWPNTYVFTKAMGEMLLGHMRGDMPLVIIRPTIITSIYSDPIPGWIEGIKTIDNFILGYASGKLPCFVCDLNLVMDTIPGDMVSNAMIVALAKHLNELAEHIYHVGSSVRNPVKYSDLVLCTSRYFDENPMVGIDGKVIRVGDIRFFSTMESLHRYLNLRYTIPLQGLKLANAAFCRIFSQRCDELSRKYNFVTQMADVYGPFSLFQGCFDDLNLLKLKMSLKENTLEEQLFQFDPKAIDWKKYLFNIHIPGVLKYGYGSKLKEHITYSATPSL